MTGISTGAAVCRCFAINTFFISNTFISNVRLKLTKKQVNAKQHPETEFLLFRNYCHSSPMLPSLNNRTYSKKYVKEQICLYT